MLIQQSQSMSSDVQDIEPLSEAIARGSVVKEIIFDNPFGDIAFHRKIKSSITALESAHGRLKNELRSSGVRTDAEGRRLVEATQSLEKCRDALHAFRREASQRAAAIQSGFPHSEASPDYDIAVAETVSTPGYQSSDSPTESTPGQWGSGNPYAAAFATRTFVDEMKDESTLEDSLMSHREDH